MKKYWEYCAVKYKYFLFGYISVCVLAFIGNLLIGNVLFAFGGIVINTIIISIIFLIFFIIEKFITKTFK